MFPVTTSPESTNTLARLQQQVHEFLSYSTRGSVWTSDEYAEEQNLIQQVQENLRGNSGFASFSETVLVNDRRQQHDFFNSHAGIVPISSLLRYTEYLLALKLILKHSGVNDAAIAAFMEQYHSWKRNISLSIAIKQMLKDAKKTFKLDISHSELLAANHIISWQRDIKTVLTLMTLDEEHTLAMLSIPQTKFTGEQQHEFKKFLHLNKASWCQSLSRWEQDFWSTLLTTERNIEVLINKMQPVLRRAYPGICNYWRNHTLVFNQAHELVYNYSASRSGVLPAYEIREAHQILEQNALSILSIELPHLLSQLSKESTVSRPHLEICIPLLFQTALSPAAIELPRVFGLHDLTLETSMLKDKKRAVLYLESIINELFGNHAKISFKLIETNYPQNFIGRNKKIGKTMSFDEKRVATLQLCQCIISYIRADASQTHSELIIVLQEMARLLSRATRNDLHAVHQQLLNNSPSQSTHESAKQIEVLINLFALYLKSQFIKEIPKDKSRYYSNLAALELNLVRILGGLAHITCKSGKDRTALLLAIAEAILLTQFNHTAKKLSTHDLLIKIFLSGHHQILASNNALGCIGLKSIGNVFPESVVNQLKAYYGRSFVLNSQFAKLNKASLKATEMLLPHSMFLLREINQYCVRALTDEDIELIFSYRSNINNFLIKNEDPVKRLPAPKAVVNSTLPVNHPDSDLLIPGYHRKREPNYIVKQPFGEDLNINRNFTGLNYNFSAAEQISSHERFVLVKGNAGVGKSILSRHTFCIANDRVWPGYLVVFISLRELLTYSGKEDLSEAIYELCYRSDRFTKTLSQTEFSKVFREYAANNKLAFVGDGYDEIYSCMIDTSHPITKLINQIFSASYQIFLTSRPYGLIGLPIHHKELNLIGFDEAGVNNYINRFYQMTAVQERQAIFDRLRSFLESSSRKFYPLAQIPLVLNMLCGLHRTLNLSHTTSLTKIYLAVEEHLIHTSNETRPLSSYQSADIVRQAKIRSDHRSEIKSLERIALLAMWNKEIIIKGYSILTLLQTQHPDRKFKKTLRLGILNCINSDSPDANLFDCSYEFRHLTFQEFYAGSCLARALRQPLNDESHQFAREFLLRFASSKRCQNTIIFCAGMLTWNHRSDFNRRAASMYGVNRSQDDGLRMLVSYIVEAFGNDILSAKPLLYECYREYGEFTSIDAFLRVFILVSPETANALNTYNDLREILYTRIGFNPEAFIQLFSDLVDIGLAEGFDINSIDNNNHNLLQHVFTSGAFYPQIVTLLIDKGLDLSSNASRDAIQEAIDINEYLPNENRSQLISLALSYQTTQTQSYQFNHYNFN